MQNMELAQATAITNPENCKRKTAKTIFGA